MDEQLKEVMGEAYKENMTAEEINSFFETKFAESGKFVPLTKYTALENKNKEYKEKDKEIASLKTELEGFKNQNLTDQEKLQKELENEKKSREDLTKQLNKTTVEKILTKGGINEEDYKDFIDDLVTDDLQKSEKLANNIVAAFQTKLEAEVKNAVAAKLKEAGELPKGGGGTETLTKEQAEKMSYSARLKLKQENPELYNKLLGGN